MINNRDKLKAEFSLYEFVKQGWHVLHPATPFTEGWAVGAICEHLQAVTEGQITRLLINVPPGFSKAARVSEPVLTPRGWKRHGDLMPGDFIYGPDGQPKRVQDVTPKFLTPEWRVTFDDGTSVITSEAHEWTVQRDDNETPRCRRRMIVETKDLRVTCGNQRSDAVLVPEPIDLPPQHGQLIDPYLLGAWLGDGSSWDGMITCHKDDAYVLRGQYGAKVSRSDGDNLRLRIPGLQEKLRIMGLRRNKHIPDAYLLGSIEQRMELLRGYLDTDGCAAKNGGVTFSQSRQNLAEQVAFIIRSLGYRTKVIKHKSRLNDKTFDSWRMSFTPLPGAQLFKLKRKQERISDRTRVNVRTRNRYVKSVERLGTEAVMSCIQVEGREYLIGTSLIPTRNSMTSNVFWPAYEWGPFGTPHVQYINASYAKSLAIRDMMYCRDLISSEWYQERWPLQWKEDDRGKQKYTNIHTGFRFATSVGGDLTGWRGQRFIIDDPHSVQGAESDAERETATFWLTEVTPSRFTNPKSPVYVIIMQRLHEADVSGVILKHLLEEQGWTHLCLPMEAEPDRISYTEVRPRHIPVHQDWVRREYPEGAPPFWVKTTSDDPDAHHLYRQDPRTTKDELLWPERYDAEAVRILKAQLMVSGGDYAVAGQLQQRPVPREGGMFRANLIEIVSTYHEGGESVRGWDLAAAKDKRSAWTVGSKLTLDYNGKLWFEDMVRIRGNPDEVLDLIKRTAELDGPDCIQSIPQDPGQAGKSQVNQFMKELHGYDVRFSLESGDKRDRARPLAAQVNVGNMCMIRGPWNNAAIGELSMFPGSTFKDITDSLSRAYAELLKDHQQDVTVSFGVKIY